MKRMLAMLLALCLMVGPAAMTVTADVYSSGTCGEDLTWVLSSDGTLTISGTGAMENYSFMNPSPWYQSTAVQRVVIQEGVTGLGDEAFLSCWDLTSVDLPKGLTSIGNATFKDCASLPAIAIPDGVISIGNSAFSRCHALRSATLPDGLISIGDSCFYDCGSLTGIDLPASVSSIGSYAFLYCNSLRRITVSGDNPFFSADEWGVLFNKDMTELVAAPGAIETYCVPAGVTHIRDTAFTGCFHLTGIDLPDSLISIGDYAFQYCWELPVIDLPDGLASIGAAAFEFCSGLTSIDFPAGLTFVDDYAFQCCDNLTSISFSGDVPVLSDCAFEDITLTAYYPAENPSWTPAVLRSYGAKITWVPYREVASGWSGATRWNLNDHGVLTFRGKGNMRNYDWSGGQPWAAYGDQISAVVINDGVTAVGSGAFKDLTNLESVTLPAIGLKTIGEAAFYGCSALKELYIPDGVYTIWEYTFKNCTSLETVRLPATLIKIDQGAFEGCTAMTELFMPTNTQIIGAWSFKGCAALEEADLRWADATEIREGAFKNCSALRTIHLPTDIQILGDSCFYGIGASEFVVPATVTGIYPWCFARAALEKITFEGNAPTIGEGAFNKITLTACYPGDNTTWTADMTQDYGGSVTWMAY